MKYEGFETKVLSDRTNRTRDTAENLSFKCTDLFPKCQVTAVSTFFQLWWARLAKAIDDGEVGSLITDAENAMANGKKEDLKKVWLATKLVWVVSGEVFEKDEEGEEEGWTEIQDLVDFQ